MKPSYRKSWASNFLLWSDLTFGFSFKVKHGPLTLVSCLSGGYSCVSVLRMCRSSFLMNF